MTDFAGGMIIGGLIIVFIFFLFRDIFMRHLLTSAVPVIENTKTGEIMDFEEFREQTLAIFKKDLIYSYKLLTLLKTTINVMLATEELPDGLRKALHTKLEEIVESIDKCEKILISHGADIDSIKKDIKNFDVF